MALIKIVLLENLPVAASIADRPHPGKWMDKALKRKKRSDCL
jgi:hypothetical protein